MATVCSMGAQDIEVFSIVIKSPHVIVLSEPFLASGLEEPIKTVLPGSPSLEPVTLRRRWILEISPL